MSQRVCRLCCFPPFVAPRFCRERLCCPQWHVSSSSLLGHNILSGFYCTFNRTSIVPVVPQHMQGRCFGNREPSNHDQPTSKTRDEISTGRSRIRLLCIHKRNVVVSRTSLSLLVASQTLRNCFVMLDVASQHHLWVGRDQIYAFCHPSIRRRSRGYDACFGDRCDRRPQVVQRSVAPNGHVLIEQHVSHRNQSCFDFTASVVFDRLQTENECTIGNEGAALDAVKLYRWQHRFLSEYKILCQAVSLFPDSVRIASSVSRIFVTYANPLVSHQLFDVISVTQTGTSHDIIRFARFSHAGRSDGSCKFGSITGQPHVVLHALFLQLFDALITETTAVEHNVTSPALITVSLYSS